MPTACYCLFPDQEDDHVRTGSLISRRHRLAIFALVGAIAIVLPAAAADGETASSTPAGAGIVEQVPVSATPGRDTAAATVKDRAIRPSLRPFRIQVSDEALADLRRRIATTKWPQQETVTDAS